MKILAFLLALTFAPLAIGCHPPPTETEHSEVCQTLAEKIKESPSRYTGRINTLSMIYIAADCHNTTN